MHGEFYGVLETYIGHCRVLNLVPVVVDLVDDDIVVIFLQQLCYVVAHGSVNILPCMEMYPKSSIHSQLTECRVQCDVMSDRVGTTIAPLCWTIIHAHPRFTR